MRALTDGPALPRADEAYFERKDLPRGQREQYDDKVRKLVLDNNRLIDENNRLIEMVDDLREEVSRLAGKLRGFEVNEEAPPPARAFEEEPPPVRGMEAMHGRGAGT